MCIPHACIFATIGAGAGYLAEKHYIEHDINEISLVCGLVMSLLLCENVERPINLSAHVCFAIEERLRNAIPVSRPRSVAIAHRLLKSLLRRIALLSY